MNANITVDISKFDVPEHVRVHSKIGDDAMKINLSDLDENTLEKLCDEFKNGVFKKAGKTPPPICIPG